MTQEELKEHLRLHKLWLKRNHNVLLIPDLNGRYLASTRGEIFSVFNGSGIRSIPFKMKPRKMKNGYSQVNIDRKNKLVHRLVALTFAGDVAGKIVHHKNGRRDDKRIANLEITDLSKNNVEGRKTISRNKKAQIEKYSEFIKYCAKLFAESEGMG